VTGRNLGAGTAKIEQLGLTGKTGKEAANFKQ
jgi:hypothetical protein